ncbi:glutathione S-transferase [Ralstonia sp. A12]|uniref:glutathione S-transferase family protein n=1 Tax=Ralstonia sp. A12 TaxID=1217052 RepID=UPI00057441B5|nr:glutathione S-transferase family protein [Ralstonia sp. A12]KHK48933.1 glutathione S-transferase [Ralstonia sp. A12]
MKPVLFYGVPQGCSLGSVIALEWLGVPYQLTRIEMMQHPWPALFARINPLNLTPAYLTEDNRVINESTAILLHLAAQKDHKLGYPQGTPEYDRLNQTLAYLNTEFFWAFSPLWIAYEMEADPPKQAMLREQGQARVAKACRYLDTLLAEREWIDGGAKRTVADAYFVALARWAEYHKALSVDAYPNLHRHLQKLRTDPAVAFAHAIENEAPAQTAGGFLGHISLDALEPRLPKPAGLQAA